MKNKKGLIIGIACFLAGIIATSAIFMILSDSDKKTDRKRRSQKETTEDITEYISDRPSTQTPESISLLKVVDIPLTCEEYAIGVDKNQPELLDKINTIIKKSKVDGKLDSIAGKYYGLNTFFEKSATPIYSAEEDPTKDQLIVATNAAYAPFEYRKGNAYYGIDMEFVAYIADQLGLELVIKDMDFNAVCLAVENGECDITIAGLTVNEERLFHCNFTESYYDASLKLITSASNHIFDNCKTESDVLKILNDNSYNLTIGYSIGSSAQFYIEGDIDWGYEGLGNSHLPCKDFKYFTESCDENSCYIIDATATNNIDDINNFFNALYVLNESNQKHK